MGGSVLLFRCPFWLHPERRPRLWDITDNTHRRPQRGQQAIHAQVPNDPGLIAAHVRNPKETGLKQRHCQRRPSGAASASRRRSRHSDGLSAPRTSGRHRAERKDRFHENAINPCAAGLSRRCSDGRFRRERRSCTAGRPRKAASSGEARSPVRRDGCHTFTTQFRGAGTAPSGGGAAHASPLELAPRSPRSGKKRFRRNPILDERAQE